MANYQLLKADIDAKVYENAYRNITGENLNSVLNEMVTTLGAEYQFAGVATIDTNPEISDAKVFYIANGKGTYTNFGGINVTEDDVVVLYWDSSWHKESTGIAREEILTELGKEVATKQNALTDTDGGYGQRVAELEKEGIASQAKLSELEGEMGYSVKDLSLGYYAIPGVGQHVSHLSYAQYWHAMRIPTFSGQTFYLRTKGGSSGRAYAFTDENEKILEMADAKATINGEIVAPQDGYLFVN